MAVREAEGARSRPAPTEATGRTVGDNNKLVRPSGEGETGGQREGTSPCCQEDRLGRDERLIFLPQREASPTEKHNKRSNKSQ